MVDQSAGAGAQEGGSIDKLDLGSITNQIIRSSTTDQFSISFFNIVILLPSLVVGELLFPEVNV